MYQNYSDRIPAPDDDGYVFAHAVDLCLKTGLASVTIREVAKRAGLSPSGLLYKYASRETFLESLFDWAIEQDREIWSARSDEMIGDILAAKDLVTLSMAIVSTQTFLTPALSSLLWELHLLAQKRSELRPVVSAWRTADLTFWNKAFTAMQLPPALVPAWASAVLSLQHVMLLSPNTEIGLCWIDDALQRLFERLFDQPVSRPGDSPWRQRAELAISMPSEGAEPTSATPGRILSSASEIILDQGCAALSHRAIAKQSGVSLSSTTHHFQSLDDIMLGAFSRIYSGARQRAEDIQKDLPTYSRAEFIERIFPSLSGSQKREQTAAFAMEDIMMTASRKPESRALATALFALTGSTTTQLLTRISDTDRTFDRLDGHVYRLTVSGLMTGHDGEALDQLTAPFLAAFIG